MPVSALLVASEGTDVSTAMQPVQGGISAADTRRLNELVEENAYLREELKDKNAQKS